MSANDKPSAAKAPDAPSRARDLLASNVFRAGIVVLAAAIIFGAWAFAEHGREDAPLEDPGVTLTLDDEYELARRAAESGETGEAIAVLERILAEDPNHARAAALLSRLRRDDGTQPAQAGGTTDPQQPSGTPGQPADEPDKPAVRDDSAYLAAADDLEALLPQLISGWQRGFPVVSEEAASVSFLPPPADTVSRAVYAVNDAGSAESALAFIENTSKVAYGQNGAEVRVGVVDGYFGTDGDRLATVAFARGRFAFEVVVRVPEGGLAAAKDATIVLAREFEATK